METGKASATMVLRVRFLPVDSRGDPSVVSSDDGLRRLWLYAVLWACTRDAGLADPCPLLLTKIALISLISGSQPRSDGLFLQGRKKCWSGQFFSFGKDLDPKGRMVRDAWLQ